VVKLLLGLLKGLAIGAGVGYGAFALGLDGGFLWLVYGLVGALVGLLVGRPLWRNLMERSHSSWESILKAVFGFGVACGIYALVNHVWGGFLLHASFLEEGPRWFQHWQPIFGGTLGALYGAFVELDDSMDDTKAKADKPVAGELPAPRAKKK
jgi:hypothetical protein